MRPSTLALAALVLAACSRGPARSADRGSVTPPPGSGSTGSGSGSAAVEAAVPTARITLEGTKGPAVVDAEVVRSPGLLEKGLMYRKYLAPDAGMLFLMGYEDDHYFWMKNTFLPLDILFITRDLKVAGILYDMKPQDTQSKGVGAPSLYVLEVNAGWARAHGVAAGTGVHLEGVDAAAR